MDKEWMGGEYYIIRNGVPPQVLRLDPQPLHTCALEVVWLSHEEPLQPDGYWRVAEYIPSEGFVDLFGDTHIPMKYPHSDDEWDKFFALYGE